MTRQGDRQKDAEVFAKLLRETTLPDKITFGKFILQSKKGVKDKIKKCIMKTSIITTVFLFLCGIALGQENTINKGKLEIKTALIIIDIQNDYFDGGANPLVESLEASLNAKALLERFREKSGLVVHIQHLATGAGSTFFVPDTDGAEIHKNVKPVAREKIVVKHYPNSFRETDLLEYLQSKGITDLVICGMMTQMCVDATTRAAKDFGFSCTVIGDACATKDLEIQGKTVKASEVQKSFLAALSSFYARVKNAQEYLDTK